MSRYIALPLALFLLATAPAASGAPARASLPDVEDEVMCVLCKIPLNVAEAPEADAERRFILSLIARGEDKAQIKQALVAQYGPAVLALPKATGFNLALYLVPVLALIAGIATLAVLWPRWRRRARRQAPAAPDTSPPPADARRLDDELARFDA